MSTNRLIQSTEHISMVHRKGSTKRSEAQRPRLLLALGLAQEPLFYSEGLSRSRCTNGTAEPQHVVLFGGVHISMARRMLKWQACCVAGRPTSCARTQRDNPPPTFRECREQFRGPLAVALMLAGAAGCRCVLYTINFCRGSAEAYKHPPFFSSLLFAHP